MSRGLPNGWTNATRFFRSYASSNPFSSLFPPGAVNTGLRGDAVTGAGAQEP
jgi:hypothetical protein